MSDRLLHVDGRSIACEDHGAGDPVVLLHGFPFDRTMWGRQIEAIARKRRVLAPDLRGFGASTVAEDDVAEGVSMHRYAQDVVDLLDDFAVDQPITLVGFSMGGYAALQFALHFAPRLRGLALLDTRAAADTPEARQSRFDMADAVLASGDAAATLDMVDKLLAPATRERRPEIVERVGNMLLAASPEAIAAAQRGMAVRPDVRTRLGEITVPTLILAGAHDAISPPEEMRRLADALPQSTYVEVADAGHLSPIESPGLVNQALQQFLDDLA